MTFSEKVWKLTAKIPKGKVSTYKEIAKALGNPKAARAVGNALKKNPTPIKVPCHRVVGNCGRIGGFALGRKKKKELLEKEGVKLKKGNVKDFEKKFYKF
ncbi:MAG: MGMT family protein [Candidatus Diapherotrites archaeon]|uniref:methylated-DNA--[protein]-cysteine S-methyltransferase n=2 Tax=Candidatus Iainarchaeum sp. TaxID=3101447 RepID=A0A8T4KVF7_9ARCH|nr:MGMT family protein [Candidatus Diapherotrites archaeon]